MKDSHTEITEASDNNRRVSDINPQPRIYPPPQRSQPPLSNSPLQEYSTSQSRGVAPNIIYSSVPNIEQQPTIIAGNNNIYIKIFGRYPAVTNCPACMCLITTKTQHTIGCLVLLMFFVFYLICPCYSCIPFFVESWHDTIHFCPKCSRSLARTSNI